jgi:hypothetical protein
VGLCAKIGVIIDVSRMRNKTSSQVRRKDSWQNSTSFHDFKTM